MTTEQTIAENNQLQTNLAMEVLDRLLYLKARSFIGIDHKDFQRVMGDVKFAVQKFELSSDSKICPYLTELIMKIMFYHELSIQCSGQLVSPSSSLGDIVYAHFPKLSTSIIDGNYRSKEIYSACLNEAEKLTLELHEILNEPIELSTLKNKKLKSLATKVKQPRSDKNFIATMAILFGSFGVHKFILGYKKEGFIMLGLLFFSANIFKINLGLVIGIIEGIIYLSKSHRGFQKTYISGKREWF